jgi:amino acid transporter
MSYTPPPPPDEPDATGRYPPPPPSGYPPPPPPPVYQGAGKTNGMAIASLVLGILGWLYLIPAILALVFGYVARGQIRERGEQGMGLAIAGIVLGWVWIGLALIFIVLLIILAATGALDDENFDMITTAAMTLRA